ncbi:MAG: hypothetical protein KAJ19_03015 [Gammaproteobacteria bacterium]|nr:hypothetical protein [Gammaproteobacteria bacterium]
MKQMIIICVLVLAGVCPAQEITKVYWTTKSDGIQCANPDGSGVETVVPAGEGTPLRLAIDSSNGHIYWGTVEPGTINRANLDGSDVTTLFTSTDRGFGAVALDVAGGNIYWITTSSYDDNSRIQRANLDGTGQPVDLIDMGVGIPSDIALDIASGKIYITDIGFDFGAARIARTNLDGLGWEKLVGFEGSGPRGIALDIAAGKMYWARLSGIWRANLDGSAKEELIGRLRISYDIALDIGDGRMYWTDWVNDVIKSANMDGSDVKTLISVADPYSIALYPIPEPGKAPVADAGDDETVYAWINGAAEIQLNGSGSYDADGDKLAYSWTWEIDGQLYDANGVSPVVELPAGEHSIELVVYDGSLYSEPNDVVVTVIEPVEAKAFVVPRVINSRNRGKFVMAILYLPDGTDKDNVKDSLFTLYVDGASGEGIAANMQRVISARNRLRVFAAFDRAALIAALGDSNTARLSIAGELKSGQCIYGTDTIRVIQRNIPRRPARQRTGRPVQ